MLVSVCMKYRLKKNIFLAHYYDTAVLLDIAQDKFHLVESVTAEELNEMFNGENSNRINSVREVFDQANFLNESAYSQPEIKSFKNIDFFEQRGVNKQYGSKINFFLVVLSIAIIVYSFICIKFFGFRFVKNLPCTRKIQSQSRELVKSQTLSDHIKFAFVLLGEPGKCLVEAVSLYLLLRLWKCPAVFCVGVRARPLLSHAWVEVQGQVLNDDDNLRSKLAIILEKS